MSLSANFPTTRPSLLLDFVNSGQMDPRITFSRASGATWFNSAGTLIGVDASSSSLTVGTGQQTLTLAATAGVDRGWIVGTSVLLSASTVTNTMTGVVVSYTASTQVLVVNVASVVGSGTYSTWQVSNLMPRFDYNPSTLAAQGLLIEESRTNLITSSAVLPAGVNVTITADTFVAPDGTTTGDQILDNATLGEHYSDSSFTPTAATNYTFSAYIKNIGASSSNYAVVRMAGDFAAYVFVQLSDMTVALAGGAGLVANSASVTPANNGWYRVTVSGLSTGTVASVARIQVAQSLSLSAYVGTGVGFAVWGRQLEAGAFPTSYIPTTATALTRAADVASVNTLSPWFNASTGTLFTESQQLPGQTAAVFPRIAVIDDGSTNNSILNLWRSDTSRLYGAVRVGAVDQADVGTTGVTQTNVNKIGFAYATNDFAASVNGGAPSTDTLGAVPSGLTTLRIGRSSGTDFLNGYLRRITYYPRRLSNAELQAITA